MVNIVNTLMNVKKVMETTAFIQFIEEEAIQSAALGAFLAIRVKAYESAWLAINLIEDELLPHLEDLNKDVGWLSPYSQGTFYDFTKATRVNLEIYKAICTTPRQ